MLSRARTGVRSALAAFRRGMDRIQGITAAFRYQLSLVLERGHAFRTVFDLDGPNGLWVAIVLDTLHKEGFYNRTTAGANRDEILIAEGRRQMVLIIHTYARLSEDELRALVERSGHDPSRKLDAQRPDDAQ